MTARPENALAAPLKNDRLLRALRREPVDRTPVVPPEGAPDGSGDGTGDGTDGTAGTDQTEGAAADATTGTGG